MLLRSLTILSLMMSAPALSSCAKAEANAAPPTQVQAQAAKPRAVFADTDVYDLPSPSGRRYQVWVDVPASYKESGKTYPVVFVTDPNFAFATTRVVRDFAGQRGRNIEEFILVGLAHDQDVTARQSRNRDYTPTWPKGREGAHGEADAYLDYVEKQVMPLVAARYRADMSRRTFLGHSYGSLLGLQALFTRPGLFQNYVLGSPSLWFDGGVMNRREQAYAAAHKDLTARVVMVTGSYEQPGPTPRHYKDTDMVADMRRFEAALKSRGYPHLSVESQVAEGEDHYTVFHDVASRGLLRVLPGKGPYTSG